MIIKIPKFIVNTVNAVNEFLSRYDSLEAKWVKFAKALAQENYEGMVLCLELYLWEEKKGLPHPHTLEEVSNVFRVKLDDIHKVYSILKIRYQEVGDLEKELFHE